MKSVTVIVLNWNGLADTRALLPTLVRSRMPLGWRLRHAIPTRFRPSGSNEHRIFSTRATTCSGSAHRSAAEFCTSRS